MTRLLAPSLSNDVLVISSTEQERCVFTKHLNGWSPIREPVYANEQKPNWCQSAPINENPKRRRMILRELAPGVTFDEIAAATEPPLQVPVPPIVVGV